MPGWGNIVAFVVADLGRRTALEKVENCSAKNPMVSEIDCALVEMIMVGQIYKVDPEEVEVYGFLLYSD
jgi:hypothetical protein